MPRFPIGDRAAATTGLAPSTGLLLMRLMIGAVGVYHGAQKLFGVFGGTGMDGFAGFVGTLGLPLPTANAWVAALSEFAGGILIAAGLLTRPMAALFAVTMLVAAFVVHPGAFGAQHGGMEYPLTLGIFSLAIMLMGAGRFSADAALARRAPGRGAPARIASA